MTKPIARARETSDRIRMAALGIGGTAAAFVLFGGLGGIGRTGTSDPFDAMPRSSFIAATVDFAELRQSPIYDAVFGRNATGADPMRRALGVGALADACGFDPMTRVQRFAVSVPEEGDRGEFGVAAQVEVTRDELERCTRSLAEKRGGTAKTREVGSFVVLEDTSTGGGGGAGAGGGSGAGTAARLAYGRGGLLVVGKGTWFDAMLGAADRIKPGVRDAAEHAALRSSLTAREGFKKPTLVATAILPRSLRERLKGEMGAEIGAQDSSSATMAGVLGVAAVGIALKAGAPGQNVDASVELVCDNADACDAVDKLVKKKRKEWSGELSLRMIGFGPLLDSLEVTREGARVRITASSGADALAATIERVMKLRGGGSGGSGSGAGGGPRGGTAADGPAPPRPSERVPAAPAQTPSTPSATTTPSTPSATSATSATDGGAPTRP